MNQQVETRRVVTQPQGNLFTLLPSQPRSFKGGLEAEFLPPRERRWM